MNTVHLLYLVLIRIPGDLLGIAVSLTFCAAVVAWVYCEIFGTVTVSHRGPDAPMGRFGGGWQWKLGVQLGRTEMIISLWVLEVRCSFVKKSRPTNLGPTRNRGAW